MKTLGILGGMGPRATAAFLDILAVLTDARADREHIPVVLRSLPQIPDRTAFLLGNGDDPVPVMGEAIQALCAQGAEWIAIPCMTCHCFYDRLAEYSPVPILNAVTLTAAHLAKQGIARVGVLATQGAVSAGLWQKALAQVGVEPILPEKQAYVDELIYGSLKAGKKPNAYRFYRLREELRSRGAQVILLGCTELPLLETYFPLGEDVLDPMRILAREAITQCGGRVKGRSLSPSVAEDYR